MSGKACVSFKVMLVEDDDGFRRTLAALLLSRFPAIELDEAADGAEAMEKVKSFLPQLIFMDVKLPGQNGFDMTRKIKAPIITPVGGNGGGETKGDSRINGCSDRGIFVLCVPLVSTKGIRGVIYSHSTNAPQGFRKDDLLFIRNLGHPADLVIENILLHEKNRRAEEALENARAELEIKVRERTSELMEANRKLNELSITDGLTRLFNHRQFLRELEAEYRRALRYRRNLALLLLDIDHFKEVNDRYGHPCGDFVLKNLAGVLRGCLRSADIAARCGGDEFAIILPETNKSKASEVAEKLRRQLEKSPFEWDGKTLNITCSIGVAALPDLGIDNWHSLLESADKSLYRAKGEGRNSVIVFKSCRRKTVPKNGQSRRQPALPAQYMDLAPLSRNPVQGITYTTNLSSTINGLEKGRKNRLLRAPLGQDIWSRQLPSGRGTCPSASRT